MSAKGWTLASVLLTSGCPTGDDVTFRERGDRRVAQWRGTVAGKLGWWWALMPETGSAVLAFGWSAGRVQDIEVDVARALASRRAEEALPI